MNTKIKSSLLLLLVAVIWGFAFAFQSMGADYVGAFTFFSFRNYFAVASMLVILYLFKNKEKNYDLKLSIYYGLFAGVIECIASLLQQFSIEYTTAANCSFITAAYVVCVPVCGLFIGKKTDVKTWLCVALEFVGLYLLCVKNGFSAINKGDLLAMACAVMFAIHILCIDKGGDKIDALIFCTIQFAVCAVMSTILMFIFETPISLSNVKMALIPLMYTGILSSAVCLSIQVSVQRNLDPTIASIIMCFESVFGAVGGWLILKEFMTMKEIFGAFIMFVAVVLSQISFKKK
ncbi:MAG: DMT family transporter [Erysipelotrichaceae bacterium]|nr:DMT family transporter [Erysipelotrichaceae bacterium]